ncbi:protein ROLLING AND ERECT LEAF 2-like [Lolium rigidum]|uniref:protein ROLLING AND ERECT LEAF 2-like n=1 Tax=Lolium rigidum TaxID=89674 RepID=UPI001F5C396B|nr:protein ROLLING AND ERECT LEAF 2-like [Lolium rigidum]
MASTRAKNEDDKALVLCQERKRYVREALDGRCALAAAHFAYIQSLRHTGFALRKFVEPDVPTDSSLYTSTSATPEPPAVRHRSVNLSPSVSHQASDSFSPAPSPLSSGRFHINRMKAGRNQVRTVEEKVPVPVMATLQTSSSIPIQSVQDLDDSSTFEAPPGTPPWDYFGLFQPVDSQLSFHDEKESGHDFENADDIRLLREKEGIPELEEELEKFHAHDGDIKRSQQEKTPDVKDGDKSTTSGREDDFEESEDDFENPSSEPLVRMFANRNDTPVENTVTNQSPAHRASEKVALHTPVENTVTNQSPAHRASEKVLLHTPVENTVTNQSPAHLSSEKVALHTPVENTVTNQSPAHLASEKVALENIDSKTEEPKIDNRVLDISMYETDESPVTSPVKEASSSVAAFPMNGKTKEPFRDVRNGVKDLYTSMKEVEILFIKASDCGKEVPRMLEADKVNFRPLLPEEKAYGLKASGFFATLFACCREEVPVPQPPPEAEVKYLTWHRSVSSHSSSSRNPLGPASKVDVDGLTGNIFSGVYMNSGSHASTLDRLYAWERKLYDEVKASGTICRQYDEKCRHLRHQESRGENQLSIDKTRAAVKDLYSRILVAIQRIDMVSKNIEDLRDKELQPQLEELIGSLTRMWATMLECHRHQHDIIKLVSNSGNMKILVRTESQFQATLLLQVELNTLCSNFQRWIGSHRSYLNSLHSWLLKCVKSLRKKKKSRKKKDTDFQITDYAVAPIFTICDQWIKLLENLPTDDLEKAIKGLVADINHCVPRQEKRRGASRSTFSVPHNGGWNDEMGANHRNVPPTDLQSSLETFLGTLADFSDASLQKYMELKVNVDKAKEDYEKYN